MLGSSQMRTCSKDLTRTGINFIETFCFTTAIVSFLILGVVFPSFLCPFCLLGEDEFLKSG